MTPLRTPRGKSDARGADVFRAIGILFEAAMQRVVTETQVPENAADFHIFAESLGMRGGEIFGIYLITATENGVRTDFYEAFLETES